jgi:hypothetical protein
VLVHRKGEFIFPVDVLLKFDNGETVREHWDGRDRWVRYTYDKTAKLVSAELDPKHQVGLDKDLFNNSYVKEQQSGARRKLASYWLVFTQVLGQACVEEWPVSSAQLPVTKYNTHEGKLTTNHYPLRIENSQCHVNPAFSRKALDACGATSACSGGCSQ